MKTLVRILMILAVFALVMGVTYVAVNALSSGVPTTRTAFEDGGRFSSNGERPNFENGERPEFPGGDRDDTRGGNVVRLIFGSIKNTGIVAIIVALVVLPKGWLRRRKRQSQINGA